MLCDTETRRIKGKKNDDGIIKSFSMQICFARWETNIHVDRSVKLISSAEIFRRE